jgi:tetratricopeptide (TPR) repeat protein
VEFGNMAEVLSDQGHLTEAEPLLRDANLVWRAANAPSFIAFGKSQRGRLAARSGRFAEATELLQSARDDYVRDGEQAEVLETDARLAECLLLRGDFGEALRGAETVLQRAAAIPGVLPQIPLLERVRGLAMARLGHLDSALGVLNVSLHAARERSARHEVAWTLDALLVVRTEAGLPPDDVMSAERARLFDQLGIVSVARPVSVMP